MNRASDEQRRGISAAATTYPKPLLRGWSHALAAVVALFAMLGLCWQTHHDMPRFLTMLIFGVSMVELYTVSAIYHIGSGRWGERAHRTLRTLDHASIFVFIAATYTPLCFNLMDGWLRAASLSGIWMMAAIGVGIKALSLQLPRAVSTSLYLVMGWISIFTLPALWEVLPGDAVALLALGGLMYTVGALVYAKQWPNPFPRVFGYHEIFHLFVIAGCVVFAIVIWVWVLPFPRS